MSNPLSDTQNRETAAEAGPHCPECGGRVTADHELRAAEILICPECRAELEVITVEPVMLAKAPDVEEDWGE